MFVILGSEDMMAIMGDITAILYLVRVEFYLTIHSIVALFGGT